MCSIYLTGFDFDESCAMEIQCITLLWNSDGLLMFL